MNIIEEKTWSHKFTCAGCASLLEATIEDVHVTNFEDTPNYYWVACPSCDTTHKIPDRDVPPKAQQAAWARR